MSTKRFILSILAIALLILLDQFSKGFFITYLKTQPFYTYQFIPMIDFVYSWNYGISFGLFREYYQYSNAIFLILSTIIVLYLIYLMKKSDAPMLQNAFILIIGGAMGNLSDRVFKGAVFDFIYIYYNDWSFPAFNVADSLITIGAIIAIYHYIKTNK